MQAVYDEPEMKTVSKIPTLQEAYQNLRPLLFDALSRFARQGLAVLPSDAMDLIHDFFVEAWEKVTAGYDPKKGRLEPYVYGAFVHFARPRIVRLLRMQRDLVDPAVLPTVAKDLRTNAETDPEFLHDREVVRDALGQLSGKEREILLGYFDSDASERALARQFKLSRYKLREELLTSMGKVVVWMDRHKEFSQSDWKIAVSLWQEQRSVAETAGCLGITEAQVRHGHERNIRIVAALLEDQQSEKSERRNTSMKRNPTQTGMDAVTALQQLFLSSGDEELLRKAQGHAQEMLIAMDEVEWDETMDAAMAEHLDPLWVAKVYETLAKPYVKQEDIGLFQSMFEARKEDERSIGQTFEEVLLSRIPPGAVRALWPYFDSLPPVPLEQRELLLKSPSVMASRTANVLTKWGITPVTIVSAMDAVGALVQRKLRREKFSSFPIVLSKDNLVPGDQVLDYQTVAKEIRFVTRSPVETSRRIVDWTVDAAQYVPFLYDGLMATPCGKGICLIPAGMDFESLAERWSETAMLPAAVGQ